jgi:hypothetical protein
MANRTLARQPYRQTFTILPDPPLAFTPVLIDSTVPIITLVRALPQTMRVVDSSELDGDGFLKRDPTF